MNTPDTRRLEEQLLQLQLAALHQHYRTQAQAAAQANWPYEVYLAALIQCEVDRRLGNRRQRRIKEAHFPLLKELADFDFACVPQRNRQQVLELAQGHYLEQAETVLLVGNPGLGKTHVAIGLGLAACRQDYRVRFYTVTHLINELQAAQAAHQLPQFLERTLRLQLVILDEFGYVPFSPTGAQLLFQFCAALHERISVLVTTNLPFSEWVQVLGDERLTSGLLDRLTFRCHILEFTGDSFRFQQALARQALTDPAAAAAATATQPSVG
jgi:DNA replication protein DnaC